MIERGVDERQKDQINQAIHKILPDFEIVKIELEISRGKSKDLFVSGRSNSTDWKKIADAEKELEALTFIDFAFVVITGDRQ